MRYPKLLAGLILTAFFPSGSMGQSGFAKSGDVNIYYQTFGKGKPVLIINGGPGFNSEGFAGMAAEIADMGYQSILYDQRGTGRSQMKNLDSTSITMDLMVKDIEAVRQELGFEEWVVLGHSFGGMMANYYAAKHPERVKAIIASSSGGMDLALLSNAGREIMARLTEQERDSLNFYRDMMRSGENLEKARKKHAQFMAPAYVFNKEHVPVVAERLTQGNMELNRLVWNDLGRIDYDTKEDLKDFAKPVLIMQGEQDVVSKELAYTADSVLPESQLIFLENSSHYGWLDQPRKYYGAIEKFLWEVYEPGNDTEKVRRVLKKYVNAIYNADSILVNEIADSALQKSGHYYSRKREEWSYSSMSFDQLIETSKTYNKKDWIPQWAPSEIEVFEVRDKTSAARVKAIWGFDYVLLSKTEKGDWRLDKILWQSYTPEEAETYFNKLKAYSEKDLTQLFPLDSAAPGSLYRGNFSPDGEKFYFFRKTGNGETYIIFESRKESGKWIKPKILTLGEGRSSDLYPTISPDGSRLVFTSYRKPPSVYEKDKAYIWLALKQKNGKWSEPVFLRNLNQPGKYHSNPAFAEDGDLVYRITEEDNSSFTYKANQNNKGYEHPVIYKPIEMWKDKIPGHHLWGGVPGPIGSSVILDVSELSSEGKRLPSDQWISYKRDSTWTTPKPLGKGINKRETWDTFVFFSHDQEELFFVRDFSNFHRIPTKEIIK